MSKIFPDDPLFGCVVERLSESDDTDSLHRYFDELYIWAEKKYNIKLKNLKKVDFLFKNSNTAILHGPFGDSYKHKKYVKEEKLDPELQKIKEIIEREQGSQ